MSSKLSEELKVTHYDYDPADSTVLTDVGWVDMKDYDAFMVTTFASALTGNGVTVFKILANSDSAGGGTDVTVKTHAVGSAPDAVGDYLVLDCTKDEIIAAAAAAGVANVRYVSAQLDCANAADEQVVTYIRRAKLLASGNTADVVA